MQVASQKMVKIHYTLKDDSGTVIDSSVDGEPLEYMQGVGSLIPGLERQLEGHEEGEKLSVTVAPNEAYGEYEESLIQTVPKSQFDPALKLEEGQLLQADTVNGSITVRVKKINEDSVTLDSNHELAGKTLHFDVEIVGVRDATELELGQYSMNDGCSCGGGCSGCSGSCSSCGGSCGELDEDDL